jgi:predicted RNase H-like HicB family nuclease
MKERVGYFILTSVAERDGDGYVAACLELGAVASGDSIEEAFRHLEKAVLAQLKALEEAGQRERVFRENGVQVVPSIDDAEVSTKAIGPDKVMKISRHQIAFHC